MSRWSDLINAIKRTRSEEKANDSERERRKSASLSDLVRGAKDRIFGKKQAVSPPIPEPPKSVQPEEQPEEQQTARPPESNRGRGASYDYDAWESLQQREIRVLQSSNVYSYFFEAPESRHAPGILYVTFLHWEPGMKSEERSGPGATYAYYDVPRKKYFEFESAAKASAGKAVWDYCRVRGTHWEHQHRYRLIQTTGEYVPRKATKLGFASRTKIKAGLGPEGRKAANRNILSKRKPFFRESTLAPRKLSNGTPNRGTPNRGEPNRG